MRKSGAQRSYLERDALRRSLQMQSAAAPKQGEGAASQSEKGREPFWGSDSDPKEVSHCEELKKVLV